MWWFFNIRDSDTEGKWAQASRVKGEGLTSELSFTIFTSFFLPNNDDINKLLTQLDFVRSIRWYYLNKGIHLYLSLILWAEFLSQCEDISLIIWFSGPNCDSYLKGKSKNLQYVRVQIFSQILDICWVHSIQFFILISKI